MTTTRPVEATTAAAPPRLGPLQYLGYAAGDAANNLAFSMTSMFLLVYYTDVVGISAAAAGTLFLLIRIWDGFADVFAGRGRGDLHHVGVVDQQEHRGHGERQVVGGVPGGVAEVLQRAEPGRGRRRPLLYRPCGGHRPSPSGIHMARR